MQKKINTICFGYQGLGNIGDDLMHLAVLSEIESAYVRQGQKIRMCDFEEPHFSYIYKIFTIDKLVFTGGNIFSIESKKSYLKLLFFLTVVAFRRTLNKSTQAVSVGINLKVSWLAKKIILKIIESLDYIHIRERQSSEFCKEHIDKDIVLKPDIVLTHDYKLNNIITSKYKTPYSIYFPSSPARYELSRSNNELNLNAPKFKNHKIISICQTFGDEKYSRSLAIENMEIIRYDIKKLELILESIQGADEIVTERYHGAVLAIKYNIEYHTPIKSEKLSKVYIN